MYKPPSNKMEVTTRLLTLAVTVVCVFSQRITESGEEKYLNLGDTYSMPCTVQNFDANNHIVYWKKTQDARFLPEADKTYTDVSHGIRVDGVFNEQTNRPYYNLNKQGNAYEMNLQNVRAEENGIYRCEVHDQNSMLSHISYQVNVIDPVDELILWGERDSEKVKDRDIDLNTGRADNTITFSSNKRGFVMCIARGSMPIPVVKLTVNARSLSGETKLNYTIAQGPQGVQRQTVSLGRYVKGVSVSEADDGKMAVCESWIEDKNGQQMSPKKRKEVPLSVLFEPHFVPEECKQDLKVQEGVQDFEMSCKYKAKPNPLKTWFTTQSKGTVIETNNQRILQYNAHVSNEGDYTYVAKLRISQVANDHFQSYTLHVRTELGTKEITLTLKRGTESLIGGSSDVRAAGLVLLLSAFLSLVLS